MPPKLAYRPTVHFSSIPEQLWHGTNKADLIRATAIRPSNANAGGRGIADLVWFFADFEPACDYCTPTPHEGPNGWGEPEVLLYQYSGDKPLCDLRGLQRPELMELVGGEALNAALKTAGYGGVLTHSTTSGDHDEWGFLFPEDLSYINSTRPPQAWFKRKEEDEIDRQLMLAKTREGREHEQRLLEQLQEIQDLKNRQR